MTNKDILIFLWLVLLSLDYILPMSTIVYYEDDAQINIFLNREDVTNYYINQSELTLYNVEPYYFIYFTLGCDYNKSPKCTLENRTK